MNGRDRDDGEQLSVHAWQAWRRTVAERVCGKVCSGGEPTETTPRLLAELSNEEILVALKSFVGAERQSLARVIVYLVEIEERRIHLELGSSSMFDFCTRRLGFSEGEAFRRLTAARLARRLPVLLDAIASGRIHLSSLVLLRDVLTEANVDAIVAAASGKTKREVEELVARMAPKPDVRASIRKLPERRSSSSAASSQESFTTASQSPPTSRVSPSQLQAIAERRYKVQLTANETLRDKLELARALMSHRNPNGDLAVIVERAVELLIEKLSKEKLGTTSRARLRKSSAKHGYVTRAARREAFARDGMQCSFVGENGQRCSARSFLELDHVTPRALGGSGEAENLRVFCRAHNHDAAERVFGRAHVEARIRTSRKRSSRAPDRSAPSAGPPNFSQRKYERERGASSTASSSAPAFGGLALEASHGALAPEHARDNTVRKQVRTALLTLGFRGAEADRALLMIDREECEEAWRRPIETLVREALGILT